MKQNVLFILVDCLRADKCYGNNRTAKTPNIDSLIKKGTFFSKTIATTTSTTPSVASIFTGLYTFAHGIRSLNGYKLTDNVKTLAEIFKDNGYNTYAEVTGPLVPETGLNKGFDSYSYRHSKEYFIHKWGDNLIAKFKNRGFKEPWFIFIHLWELHGIRCISEGFNNNKFGRNKYERALSGLDAKLGELFKYIDFNNTTVIFSADHGDKIIETMFAEYLHGLKQHIKKILKIPRKVLADIIKKTFKLFKFKYDKLTKNKKRSLSKPFGHGFHIYDCGVVIPLIIVENGSKEFSNNKNIPTQVRQIDIFPTLIDAFNFNSSSKLNILNIHGRSLVPLIKGKDFDNVPAFCEACVLWGERKHWKAGLRTPKYKFIYRPYNDDKHEELYDLDEDPLESKNIIKSKPQIADVLKRQLLKIRKEDLEEIKLVGQKMTEEEENALTERLRSLGYIE